MFEEKYKTIGLNIMYYRRALSLTQSELAEKAQMSRARVSDIECGKGPFNMESIFLLAQALGVDPVRLLQERKREVAKIKLRKHIAHSEKQSIRN